MVVPTIVTKVITEEELQKKIDELHLGKQAETLKRLIIAEQRIDSVQAENRILRSENELQKNYLDQIRRAS